MANEWIDRRGLWKDKFRAMKLQIRDRFRIAVDKHRRRPRFSDAHLSFTLQRWLRRLRNLRKDSLSPTSPLYRHKVKRNVNEFEDPIIIRMLQALAVPIIGNACHVFMHGLNHVQMYGADKLYQVLIQRPEGKPLVTVSNHVASVDDPLVIASLLPPSVLLDAQRLRWTLCATDRCFRNPMTSAFFRSVKVLPVSRGEGVSQKGLDMAIEKLNKGGWVHIFPEGSRSRDGGRTMGSAKRGVGRLIIDANNIPIVVPFVHTGMQEIMPIGANFPRIGKRVTVLVGDPIQFDDLLAMDDTQHVSRGALYDAISSRIGHRLHELKAQVDKLAFEETFQSKDQASQNTERVAGIFQQVDWEAFGMGSYIMNEGESSFKQEFQTQPKPNFEVSLVRSPDQSVRMSFSHEGGIVSRIRGYMDPADQMGFAARGLLMSNKTQDSPSHVQELRPLKVWKQFMEANIFQQWNANAS